MLSRIIEEMDQRAGQGPTDAGKAQRLFHEWDRMEQRLAPKFYELTWLGEPSLSAPVIRQPSLSAPLHLSVLPI